MTRRETPPGDDTRDGATAALPEHPDAEDFRALARSAPWRWTTLDAVVTTHPSPENALRYGETRSTVRLRGYRGAAEAHVESLDGTVLQRGPRRPPTDRWANRNDGRSVAFLSSGPPPTPDEERAARAEHDRAELDALNSPPLRPDGLVAARSRQIGMPDPPYWTNYSYVALLDPAELADGRRPDPEDFPGDEDTGLPFDERPVMPGMDIRDVRAEEAGGRLVWSARILPTRYYEPRCGCCALIMTTFVAREEWGEQRAAEFGWAAPDGPDDPNSVDPGPDPEYAEVSLDVATGVVARLRIVGGRDDGAGWDVEVRDAN